MSTHNKKRHRNDAMPSIPKILSMTSAGDLVWRKNHTPDVGLPSAMRPNPDRSRYFSDWMNCLVTTVDHTWYDTRIDGKRLVLAESTPATPTLPNIVELYSVDYEGHARILAADTDGNAAETETSVIWSLLKAVEKQWFDEIPDDIEDLVAATAVDLPAPSEIADEFYADRDGVTLQELFRVVGRERLCEVYADFWSRKIADRDGLSDQETEILFWEYHQYASQMIPTILDVDLRPCSAQFKVGRASSRHEPDRWRLIFGCAGDSIQLAAIKTTLFSHDGVCPTYWSTEYPDSTEARNAIRRKALEDAALIVMCWLSRMKGV